MIEKTKTKNEHGLSFDHEFTHRLTGVYANIVRVYEYSAFTSRYEPTDTWRVDFSGKTEFWGSFIEGKSYAIKKLKATMPFKVGDYVKPNEKYFVDWDKYHINEFTEEVFKVLRSDEEKRIFKVIDFFRNGEIDAKYVYINDKKKPALGATMSHCHYTDFTKTTLDDGWNGLLDIKKSADECR